MIKAPTVVGTGAAAVDRRETHHAPSPPRAVALPEGGTLLVRAVRPDDITALEELYERLDPEAAYRRFFSGFRPHHDFFEHLVAVAERGGAGLVAEVVDGGDGARLVGEAGYEPLDDGNGELAITVDRTWRGWLGPYLLDALLEVAAAAGVPNLEADVLLTNGPMLALLRARGYAAVPSDDWSVVRAVVGAAHRRPSWTEPHDHLRVLVEGAGGHWPGAAAAQAAGAEVLGCPGPTSSGAPCPVLAGEPCPLVAGADAVVMAHPDGSERWEALRVAHRSVHPDVPVCVQSPRPGASPVLLETPIGDDDAAVAAVVERAAGAAPGERS